MTQITMKLDIEIISQCHHCNLIIELSPIVLSTIESPENKLI